MKVRLTVAQYKQFNVDVPWPEGWYIEDEVWSVNGVEVDDSDGFNEQNYADADVLTLEDGTIYLDNEDVKEKPKLKTLAAMVKKWLDEQKQTTYVVTVDNDFCGKFEHFVACTTSGVKTYKKI